MDHLGLALANAIINNLPIDDTTELFKLNQIKLKISSQNLTAITLQVQHKYHMILEVMIV
jgi:hypothetical protein